MAMSVLDIALSIAAAGLPVFPCGRTKKPAIAKKDGGRGFLDAVTDEPLVRHLFGRTNAYLVGVPTGERSNFDVLDFDYVHGAAQWEHENAHRLPKTRTHRTMSGGKHMVLQHAPGVRNLQSKFAAGMDVRGDGGYIIMPPSIGYTVDDDAPIAEWPTWLLELVLKAPPKPDIGPYVPVDIASRRLDGFMKAVLDKVRAAPEGAKHNTLRNAALSLGGIQASADLSDSQITSELLDALPKTVKDWNGAKATIAWGLENGRKRPVTLPDRERPGRVNGYAKPDADYADPIHEDAEPPSHAFDGYDHDSPFVGGQAAAPKPIQVKQGERHIAADAGITALVAAKVAFYQRDKTLVRAAVSKAKSSDGRIISVPGIVPVTNPVLARALGQSARWERANKDGELLRIDPPKEVVEQIGAMTGEWPFPPLAGVIGTPTLRPDGSVLIKEGYDEATGLYLLAPPKMPRLIDAPTRADAEQALQLLLDLIDEFPFDGQTSRSVGLSMLLTPVLRGGLAPAVPMHVVTAPQPGTGKSYLLDTAAMIATGERCPVIAMAPREEETEKRLVGAALAGFPIMALDNVNDVLTGDFLAQATERPILQLRALGSSALVRITNSFTVFANGNNIAATADLVRRTLRCALDSDMENPEERQFRADPVAIVSEDRGKYVAACLTIARAYIAAGRPKPCPRLPSFGPWSDLVRSALVWLGRDDPVASMDFARADDPSRQTRGALFDAWANEIGLTGEGMFTSELVEKSQDFYDGAFCFPLFRQACLAVAKDNKTGGVGPEKLGLWLRKAANNRSGDYKLLVDHANKLRPRWVLQKGASNGRS